tara:strand:+ start:218 stop:673 length:456 start_codon:yes stop_codon:yes gene_type:complete
VVPPPPPEEESASLERPSRQFSLTKLGAPWKRRYSRSLVLTEEGVVTLDPESGEPTNRWPWTQVVGGGKVDGHSRRLTLCVAPPALEWEEKPNANPLSCLTQLSSAVCSSLRRKSTLTFEALDEDSCREAIAMLTHGIQAANHAPAHALSA